MSACFQSKWVKKTRKVHSCDWCGKRIEAGSATEYQAGVFEGDFFAGHLHPECAAAKDSLPWQELQDGWMPGDWARGRADDDYDQPPAFPDTYRGKPSETAPKL
jgi:hypothetical protein